MIRSAYLAPDGFEAVLGEELALAGARVVAWHGNLALSADAPVPSAWALDVWTAPVEVEIASVKAASDALRAVQRNWGCYAAGHHRRSALIVDRLPTVKARKLMFPELPPTGHLGAWTLLAPDRMVFSPTKTSPFVNGACQFEEDRFGPPSRAYLKLWEAWTRIGAWPAAGERCLDLGASPGGWTWAAATLGAAVTAIDKAPVDPRVSAMPNVTWREGSAFALEPEPVDWLLSDIVAYPDRLLAMVQAWIASDAAAHIVCTIKFQGATDHEAARAFAAIDGGRVMHLFHNKHELTFVWSRQRNNAPSPGSLLDRVAPVALNVKSTTDRSGLIP